MVNRIIELLKNSAADAWEVTDLTTHGWEFYFIRHRLDQHRAKQVEHITVKVYRRVGNGEGSFLGSASDEIPPTASEAEAKAVIDRLCDYAAYVRNPAYTLNGPDGGEAPAQEPVDVAAISRDFIETMDRVPETETEDLNSYEIFVSGNRRRFINSEGVDVTSVYPSSMVEAVVNARSGGQEIELYRMYRSGACDREGLIRSLGETLAYGRDKLIAAPTPNLGKADVLFSTDAACEIYDWFIGHMSAQMQVQRVSDWKQGQPVADSFRGDRITLEALTSLPNSSANAAYDAEGARIRPMTLIKDGVAGEAWGSRQFSQYLGLADSCMPGNFAVSGGSASAEELRRGDYLEVVEFSSFEVDPFNGNIAGEIRLGYLHEGGKVTVVSGGSVGGAMTELMKDMRMSKEQRQYNNMLIPALTVLRGAVVAGT